MSQLLSNKVAESGLLTIDLSDFFPKEDPQLFDITPFLYKGLILKEKDFRESLSKLDWNQFKNKTVLVFCSAEAIIPSWASMLVAAYLIRVTPDLHLTNLSTWRNQQFEINLEKMDVSPYIDQRVVVKGCGETPIPESGYFILSKRLVPVVKSLMYGEPCSTVPVFKKK